MGLIHDVTSRRSRDSPKCHVQKPSWESRLAKWVDFVALYRCVVF
jgi:hypothetical protein